jgi:GH3 auxin-responsive promoter
VLALAQERGLAARTVTELWPRLRLLTGGGVRYAPYRPRIEARLGRHVPYFDVYNATEGGIMGVQDRMHDGAMRLLPDAGVFYEFVPLAELQTDNPRRLSMWEVEVGEVYALAVSTPSGLFAYILGDCLRFVTTFPHRFVFEGRTKAFLNVCGEHVSQAELERAVAAACVGQGVVLTDFSVLAQVSASGIASHTYLIECEGPGSAEKMAEAIDVEVGRNNEDYRTHRSSALSLAAPRVVLLPRGASCARVASSGGNTKCRG